MPRVGRAPSCRFRGLERVEPSSGGEAEVVADPEPLDIDRVVGVGAADVRPSQDLRERGLDPLERGSPRQEHQRARRTIASPNQFGIVSS